MKVNSLKLLYFRNYDGVNLNFHSSLNIFVGNNANGKTNIIEALFLMSLGKSFRAKSDVECIKIGEMATCVSCNLTKDNIQKDIMLAINNKGKNIKVSGIKRNKIYEFVGELNTVLFSPDDLQLIKGSPSIRRNFIDREFYQFSKIYHKYSLIYKHILKQRNSFLKNMRKNKNDNNLKSYLEVLSLQLAKLSLYITKKRYEFIQKISKIASENVMKISDNNEVLEIRYKSSILEALQTPYSKINSIDEKMVCNAMMDKFKDDILYGSTKIGIHHDDLIFLINGLEAKKYASQGQQKTIVLALKLAEIEFLKNSTGTFPILLLDDVLSELDKIRQKKLLDIIDSKIQTFITTPTLNDIKKEFLENSNIFYIKEGKIYNNLVSEE